MNFGVVVLALVVVCGSIFGIFAIAGANQPAVYDTFGNTTGTAANTSHMAINNATAPAMGAAGGMAFILVLIFLFLGATLIVRAVAHRHSSSYHR